VEWLAWLAAWSTSVAARKIHENLKKSNRIYKNPTRILPESYQNPTRIPPESYQNPIKILQNPLESLKIHENLTKSNRIIENPWE